MHSAQAEQVKYCRPNTASGPQALYSGAILEAIEDNETVHKTIVTVTRGVSFCYLLYDDWTLVNTTLLYFAAVYTLCVSV